MNKIIPYRILVRAVVGKYKISLKILIYRINTQQNMVYVIIRMENEIYIKLEELLWQQLIVKQ